MDLEAFLSMNDNKQQAGYQRGKDRATFQGSILDLIQRGGSAFGRFLGSQREWAGNIERRFVNINSGKDNFVDAEGTEVGKKAGDNRWHKDHFWSERTTHRVLSYYTENKLQTGSIIFCDDEEEVELECPHGCSFVIPKALLEGNYHAHGCRGRVVSIVTEVVLDSLPAGATKEEIGAAGRAQPPLPLHANFGDWTPDLWFFGDVLDFGAGGGGTARRMAVTQLIDQPKAPGERRAGVKEAREASYQLPQKAIKRLASMRGAELGAKLSKPELQQQQAKLMHARPGLSKANAGHMIKALASHGVTAEMSSAERKAQISVSQAARATKNRTHNRSRPSLAV